MSDLLKNIDARTKLAGTNKLEILMFTLGLDKRTGREETYGINVFKVREVMRIPPITRAPDMPEAVEGMVSLRGALVPVIDLAKYAGIETDEKADIMIVTEYNGHTQGFLVKGVDNILRLDWSAMRVPPAMLVAQMGGLVTAITELKDGRLVMMMDVEKVLSETGHFDEDEMIFKSVKPIGKDRTVFLCRRFHRGAAPDPAHAGCDGSQIHRGHQRAASLAGTDQNGRLCGCLAHLDEGSGAGHPDRRGDAGNGRLHADAQDQVGQTLCRHPGIDAFVPVQFVQPAARQGGGRGRVCAEVRTAETGADVNPAVGLVRS